MHIARTTNKFWKTGIINQCNKGNSSCPLSVMNDENAVLIGEIFHISSSSVHEIVICQKVAQVYPDRLSLVQGLILMEIRSFAENQHCYFKKIYQKIRIYYPFRMKWRFKPIIPSVYSNIVIKRYFWGWMKHIKPIINFFHSCNVTLLLFLSSIICYWNLHSSHLLQIS